MAESFLTLTKRGASLADPLKPFGVEIQCAPSKETADKKCPEAWSAMLSILDALKQRLPESVTR